MNRKIAYENLARLVDLETGIQCKETYYNAPDTCGCCNEPFAGQTYMVDGALKGSIAWANMCAVCFYREGKGIGWGEGQLYLRQDDGSWLLVAGFQPDE